MARKLGGCYGGYWKVLSMAKAELDEWLDRNMMVWQICSTGETGKGKSTGSAKTKLTRI